jgi:hypothetical protein
LSKKERGERRGRMRGYEGWKGERWISEKRVDERIRWTE